MTGETLSHYRVLERIGEGATSVVYKAEDLALGRPVALKLLPPGRPVDFGVIARLQHEARTISSLAHPNICTVYETGEHGGRHFIVMEYLEGQVLSRLIAGRPLDAYRLLEIAIQIADGLAAAHAEHVVHQDVKPANIHVSQHDHVKLLDFGLAVLAPGRRGEGGAGVVPWGGTAGTAPYMSPEQTLGEPLDARTDLFSLGITIFEMATGRRPFVGGSTAALMEAIRSAAPPRVRSLNPSVPEALERIVEKALEKNRKLRYQTASDMGADLRRLKRDLDSQNRVFVPPLAAAAAAAAGDAPSAQSGRRTGIGRMAVSVAAVICLGGAALAGGRLLRSSGSEGAADPPTASKIPAGDGSGSRAAAPDVALDAAPRAEALPVPAVEDHGPAGRRGPDAPADAPGRRADTPPESPASDRPVPDGAWAREQLAAARSKVDLGLYEQAIGTLEALLSRDNGSDEALEAYLLMASIHERRDRPDDAISTYVDLAASRPGSPRTAEALVRMAGTLLRTRRRGRETEALNIYAEAAGKYPSSPWAARALMAKGDLEERLDLHERDTVLGISVPSALISYRQVVDRYPRSEEHETALWKLSRLYQRAKRYDLAAGALETLGRRYPGSRYDGWFAAGEIYDKRLKQPSAARDAYSKVPTSSPRFDEARKRLERLQPR